MSHNEEINLTGILTDFDKEKLFRDKNISMEYISVRWDYLLLIKTIFMSNVFNQLIIYFIGTYI